MAIAAAKASAMVGAIGRGLVAACDRLPVVIAEATRHTRSKPGVVQRAKEMIQPHFEGPVHPTDHVLRHGHASFFGGMWILPRKVLIHELGNSFRDSAALAVLLDYTSSITASCLASPFSNRSNCAWSSAIRLCKYCRFKCGAIGVTLNAIVGFLQPILPISESGAFAAAAHSMDEREVKPNLDEGLALLSSASLPDRHVYGRLSVSLLPSPWYMWRKGARRGYSSPS